MNRQQLEHIIRAAGDIADDDEIIVVGSQSILGQFPNAPDALLVSVEADVYPKNHVERADVIDGCIGEGSPFHETFGYYAQGVGPTTSVLPHGWEERLFVICNANTRGVRGYCLEVHDLAIAKAVAGREKDLAFLEAAAQLLNPVVLRRRLDDTVLLDEIRRATHGRFARRIHGFI